MKLYWRVKRDGKWTWRPVVVHWANRDMSDHTIRIKADQLMEEE